MLFGVGNLPVLETSSAETRAHLLNPLYGSQEFTVVKNPELFAPFRPFLPFVRAQLPHTAS